MKAFSVNSSSKIFLLMSLGILVLSPQLALAEEAKEDDGPPEILKPSVAASQRSYRRRADALEVDSQGASPGDEASPILAGIRRDRKNKTTCLATLRNTTDKKYSVQFEVKGMRGSRTELKRFFTAVVPGEGAVTKRVTGCNKGLSLQVAIKSGRRLE